MVECKIMTDIAVVRRWEEGIQGKKFADGDSIIQSSAFGYILSKLGNEFPFAFDMVPRTLWDGSCIPKHQKVGIRIVLEKPQHRR